MQSVNPHSNGRQPALSLDKQNGGPNESDLPSPKICLLPDWLVNIEGKAWAVERRLRSDWYFLSKENEPKSLSDREIAELMAQGKFFVLDKGSNDHANGPQPIMPLNVGKKAHAENMRRLAYVLACKRHPDYCRSRRVLLPIIKKVQEDRRAEFPDEPDRPCFSSLLSWIDLYDKHGASFGAAALSPRHDLKGRYGERLAEYQLNAIEAGIQVWLRGIRGSNPYATVLAEVARFDREGIVDKALLEPTFLDEQGALKPPSKREFERRCALIDPLVRDAMQKGIRYSKRVHRTYNTNRLPERPYQEVEADHAVLDVVLKHRTGLVLGRAYIVVFRDRATAMIIGYAFGFDAPSYASFLRGLESAMLGPNPPASATLTNRPNWYGRIENLFTDNGPEFKNRSIKEAAQQLGFNLIYLPKKEPWLKGQLENYFRQLGIGLTHNLPGTTLEHALATRDYETLGEATVYVDQFDSMLAHWVFDVYNARPNKTLGFIRGFDSGVAPLDAWRAKKNELECDQLPSRELFIALAGLIEKRTIQNNGIRIDHIIYEGPMLTQIVAHPKHRSRQRNKESSTYLVARDPYDLGRVFLVDPYTGNRIEVPACAAHAEYASGLTLFEHQVIVKNAREERNSRRLQHKDLVETQAKLNSFAAAISASPKFKTVQKKLARWLEGDRIRQQRSKLSSFPPKGEDYLEPQRRYSAPAVISAGKSTSEQRETPELHAPAVGAKSADLAEFKKQHQWRKSYV